MSDTDDLYSIPQAQERAGVQFNTLYRAAKKGELSLVTIAGRKFVTGAELDRYREARANRKPFWAELRELRAAATAKG